MVIHLFDLGLGGAVAVAGCGVFFFTFLKNKSQGQETLEAIANALLGDRLIHLGDAATDVFLGFDILRIKFPHLMDETHIDETFFTFLQKIDADIDQEKARLILQDLQHLDDGVKYAEVKEKIEAGKIENEMVLSAAEEIGEDS